MDSNKKFSGIFDEDSFLIRIVENREIFDCEENNTSNDPIDHLLLMISSSHSQRGYEALSIHPLVKLPREALESVQHEMFHWVQSLSLNLRIFQFLVTQKLARVYSNRHNLYPEHFPDTLPFTNENDQLIEYIHKSTIANNKNFVEYSYDGAYEIIEEIRKQFGCKNWRETIRTITRISQEHHQDLYQICHGKSSNDCFLNIMETDPPVAMPFVEHIHPMNNGQIFPCYAAILDYFFYIDFSLKNVIESVTYVSEFLKKDKSVPEIDFKNPEELKYLGIWEFYKRLNQDFYKNEKELILSFLAICDLAINVDVFSDDDPSLSLDEKMTNNSFPYRFGKLVSCIRACAPLQLIEGEEYSKTIENYQDAICKYMGITHPTISIRKIIFTITCSIAIDIERMIKLDKSMFQDIILAPFDEINKRFDDVFKFIDYLNEKANSIKNKISASNNILGSILNTLIYKLKNRGKFILYYLYQDEIMKHVPRPVVLYDGEIYTDISAVNTYPYHVQKDFSMYDYINLFLAKSIADNKCACQFLARDITCWYQKNGLGCPSFGLEEEEKTKRRTYGFDDHWCHWTYFLNLHQKNAISN